MNNINTTLLKIGGGNSLNIIRITSKEQWVNIVESDMNGTLDVSNIANRVSRWNYFGSSGQLRDYTNTQNNTNDTCCASVNYAYAGDGDLVFLYVSKNHLNNFVIQPTHYYISSFRPIIEYR